MNVTRQTIALIIYLLGATVTQVGSTTEIRIISGDWHPYTHPDQITLFEQHVNNIFLLDENIPIWSYTGFDFALEGLRRGQADLGFPFFLSPDRQHEFVFSTPLANVHNIVIFNRQNQRLNNLLDGSQSAGIEILNQRDITFGLIRGYNYDGLFGQSSPNSVRLMNSERQALAALLAGDIDLLPIAESVWRSLQLRYFPDRYHLVRTLPGLYWDEGIHLIAPKNEDGKQLIERFNAALEQFPFEPDDFSAAHSEITMIEDIDRGTIRLKSTALQPLILGHTVSESPRRQILVIPDGTSALVIEWADVYFDHNQAQSVVQLMKAQTQVLLLNGPHAGTRVLVENAHIEIR